jgi:3-dehydroquinate synthase
MAENNSDKTIFISSDISADLSDFFNRQNPPKVFVLTDSNTFIHCLPLISKILPANTEIFTIPAGESQKNIENLQKIWNFLTENFADKNSLLINLGGGVITDIGGFAASTYKRGMNFIHIPTGLLSQVDASVGGKNGINFRDIKNIIGTIRFPDKILISPQFLKTLPHDEFISGLAEMLKHGLIADESHAKEIFGKDLFSEISNPDVLLPIIRKSIQIKTYFTNADPFEKGIRKALNFGHTFGHAFEQLSLKVGKPIKHGNAVAYGMICELFVSHKKLGFEMKSMLEIIEKTTEIFGKPDFDSDSIPELVSMMHHDKKNTDSQINCTCLSKIGKYEINVEISDETAKEALVFYKQLS